MNEELGIVFQLDYMNIPISEQVKLLNPSFHINQPETYRPCVCVSLFNPEFDAEKLKKLRSAFSVIVMCEDALWNLRDWAYLQFLLITLYDAGYKLKIVRLYHSEVYIVEDVELLPDEHYQLELFRGGDKWIPDVPYENLDPIEWIEPEPPT